MKGLALLNNFVSNVILQQRAESSVIYVNLCMATGRNCSLCNRKRKRFDVSRLQHDWLPKTAKIIQATSD